MLIYNNSKGAWSHRVSSLSNIDFFGHGILRFLIPIFICAMPWWSIGRYHYLATLLHLRYQSLHIIIGKRQSFENFR